MHFIASHLHNMMLFLFSPQGLYAGYIDNYAASSTCTTYVFGPEVLLSIMTTLLCSQSGAIVGIRLTKFFSWQLHTGLSLSTIASYLFDKSGNTPG